MNRGIDYRTDFYSLGVTFYELLTGEVPFQSNDPIEIVHSHIAKAAPLVHEINLEIPPVLSEIVNKLMAKNAEDRYQSAVGLKFDLEKCLTQLQENDRIESFEIGRRDVSDRFLIPDKLYGRETEVETLIQAFERVSEGATEMMLVAGFSGIGKTAVVNEVHKPIVRQRGYFIKGKYDQFQRNIPFSAFVQAFRDLMGQLLSESDWQL
jgi:serine/threonine protein kinase